MSLTERDSHQVDGRSPERRSDKGKIWWSNGFFFIALHLFAIYGALYLSPISQVDKRTLILCFISFQSASFGITIGYHRLWSHRAFTARLPLRIALAWMGSLGFQGSIKWWVMRHRLHHRFTDSPVHDPYAATRGLFYAHCGWIFRKPTYSRMKLLDRTDLEADPVVRFQHRFFVPIAVFSGMALPYLIAKFGWNDGLGGLVWGGAVARLLIWHTTFCINSLAHWTGLQPYTEEVTARGNILLALLTSGEGNHNFHHAFPKDFRNGPHPADWDPSKWIIYILHRYTSLVPSIARTPEAAVVSAQARVHMAEADRLVASIPPSHKVKPKEDLPLWTKADVRKRHGQWIVDDGVRRRRVLLVIEGCVVDAGSYLEDHPGGEHLLLSHSIAKLSSFSVGANADDSGYSSSSPSSPPLGANCRLRAVSPGSSNSSQEDNEESVDLRDATRAFFGGMNNHSGAAKERMRCMRIARLAT
ncbi:hypothetical protein BCR39DRAFT_554136 [Naematelia encephala]|uniref:Acyl-CoA desaturase n=1 Tax=Naematelia encephala TaxID=71784 RepID=A0A1Y2AFE4_9TREE|nr:hypothetical protein BCR39DRAFT_554136 [Naematelia encephala]